MKKVFTMLGDYYHPYEWVKAALDKATESIEEDIEWIEIPTNELASRLRDTVPAAVILFKENRVNPQAEHVEHWMTAEIEEVIIDYVSKGGAWLAWHAGLASYPEAGSYVEMLKGYFEYHPVEHPMVSYQSVENQIVRTSHDFEIKDEHYFVHCNTEETNVFLQSVSERGHSIAGWAHGFGKGRVSCLTPAHNKEGLTHSNFTNILQEVISWTLLR
ncbi:hypothetical protein GCM10011391_04170 [Pullulanibacillus camelliae]|uniref:ThuA-like domain-containing protein n=1 Tax=Pullulanibacillus camelliae TaxID=1707096 RepID=A0A8J2VK04_9BACL|nr:ThuA domain-containing protein [Pullulanibacillus camelliae]GGE28761.1 hypothetical protein GCM10011391_04170 [Pullulanibacillus camelliae]